MFVQYDFRVKFTGLIEAGILASIFYSKKSLRPSILFKKGLHPLYIQKKKVFAPMTMVSGLGTQ